MALVRKNPFKEIQKPLKEVPPGIRKKVMADVAAAKLVMDLVSLFADNYPSVLTRTLERKKKGI